MNKISVIGLDLAKNVFQVHAVDEESEVVLRKQLKRRDVLKILCANRTLSDRHRSLWGNALLGARAEQVGSYGSGNPRQVCEAVCQK